MLTTSGTLLGELLSGIMITFLPMRLTLSIFMGFCALAAVILIGGGRQHVIPIYNRKT